jgi:hypothetical protein
MDSRRIGDRTRGSGFDALNKSVTGVTSFAPTAVSVNIVPTGMFRVVILPFCSHEEGVLVVMALKALRCRDDFLDTCDLSLACSECDDHDERQSQ